MKQRFLLSLLSIGALVYFALPLLPLQKGNGAMMFSIVWLGFCLIAFGGNLSGLLYRKKLGHAEARSGKASSLEQQRKRRMGI